MRFLLCASVLVAVQQLPLSEARVIPGRAPQGATNVSANRANETTLAGLRPGRDTFMVAEKRFKAKNLREDRDSGAKEWRDACSGRTIRIELDAESVIQSITVTTLGSRESNCGDRRAEFLESKNWVTGLGLRVGDSQDQVTGFYGDPNSSGPAVKNGHELELMHYQFKWAGSDVPQFMEVLCARETGRVVEITLAFPSL